ncbi:hypothetical protein FHS40_001168 [Streptomyces spectabilis]|uniref:Uncharacterized protein n=1 Tax=Streptomyces spectabilis TaxID=68270 RepID=A0A7W8ESX3_STRST|nr:hypothetical protein [Streptomyces spectabilis]
MAWRSALPPLWRIVESRGDKAAVRRHRVVGPP